MADWFDLIHSGLLHQPDANEEAKRFLDQKAAENAAAVTGGAAPPLPLSRRSALRNPGQASRKPIRRRKAGVQS